MSYINNLDAASFTQVVIPNLANIQKEMEQNE